MVKSVYVIEGMDGAGKSSVARALNDLLTKSGVKSQVTNHPSRNTQSGSLIRSMIEDRSFYSMDELTREMLFITDRVRNINNLIKDCDVLICDRFRSSSYIPGNEPYDVQLQYERLQAEISAYDIPIFGVYLICDPDTSIERIDNRGEGRSIFETRELIQRQYSNIFSLCDTIGIEPIDVEDKTPGQLAVECFDNLYKFN